MSDKKIRGVNQKSEQDQRKVNKDTEQKNNITLLNNLINDTNKAFTKLYNICYPSPTQITMR